MNPILSCEEVVHFPLQLSRLLFRREIVGPVVRMEVEGLAVEDWAEQEEREGEMVDQTEWLCCLL